MNRFIILIEDDWELRGNGSGNVAHLQYLPSLFLLNIADKLGLKISFMVESLQQLAFLENAHKDRNLRIQASIWEENVRLMKEKGHDVQLHIHPQWYHTRYHDGYFELNNNWNIATYDGKERLEMITSSINYLNNLLRPLEPSYKPIAFKAGTWALQPSQGILNDLADNDIRIALGVGKGIKFLTEDFCVDYTVIDEDTQPYYPDFSDIRKVSGKKEKIVILPMPFYKLDMGLIIAKFKRRLLPSRRTHHEIQDFSRHSGTLKPSPVIYEEPGKIGKIKQFFNLRNFDIATSSFDEMKAGIDQIFSRAMSIETEVIPIVLQSHTKGYPGNYNNISKLFNYLVDRYGSQSTFMTFSEFLLTLDSIPVKWGNI